MPERDSVAAARSWPASAGLLAGGWAAITLVVVGWGWLLTHPLEGSIGAADDRLAREIADARTPTLTEAAELAAYAGVTMIGAAVLVLAALLVSAVRRTWLPLLFVVLLEAGIGGIYWFGTTLDPRQRPPVRILEQGLVPDHSFPSGHTGTSMALFMGLAFLVWTYTRVPRGWAFLLGLVPLAVASSRLYQGAHHLTDVLTSVTYVAVWATLLARVVLRRDPAAVE